MCAATHVGFSKCDMADSAHLQVQFFSKDDRYSIPSSQFSIPATVTRTELNELINSQIESCDEGSRQHVFDFLIEAQLVRGSLSDHVTQHRLPTEQVLKIECVERAPPPSLSQEVEHMDWVSAVHCYHNLILTGCYDSNVRVWTDKGKLVCTAEGHTAPIKDVCWIDKDGNDWLFLSASQDQVVHIWRLSLDSTETPPTGHVTLVHQCKGHARSVEAIDVSLDRSKFCSVSWDSFVKVWSAIPDSIPMEEAEQEPDIPSSKKAKIDSSTKPAVSTSISKTRTPLTTFQGHSNAVTAIVWAGSMEGDGKEAGSGGDIITAGWDNCLKTWDVETGINKATMTGPKAFQCIDLSRRNGLIASGHADKVVRLWDTRQKESSIVHSNLSSHTAWVVSTRWSPDHAHQLLTGSYDSTLRLWDIRSCKKPLFSIPAHQGKVLCSDWARTKMLASGGTDNMLRTFSL